MRWLNKSKPIGLIFMSLLVSEPACASDWVNSVVTQGSLTQYSGARARNSAVSAGLFVATDYRDIAGITLGAGLLKLDMTSGYPITQESWFASMRYHSFSDVLSGKLTYRLDGHGLKLSNSLSYRGEVSVIAPQVSFVNYQETFSADLGFAYSTYLEGFNVQQLTPTVGFAFNQSADWLQARAYVIQTSDATLAQGIDKTTAAELKWKHWFSTSALVQSASLSALFGERAFAVDGDAAAVYSLADLQQGGATLAIEGALFWDMQSMLLLGYDKYYNQALNNSYNSTYLYFSLSKTW